MLCFVVVCSNLSSELSLVGWKMWCSLNYFQKIFKAIMERKGCFQEAVINSQRLEKVTYSEVVRQFFFVEIESERSYKLTTIKSCSLLENKGFQRNWKFGNPQTLQMPIFWVPQISMLPSQPRKSLQFWEEAYSKRALGRETYWRHMFGISTLRWHVIYHKFEKTVDCWTLIFWRLLYI